MDLFDEIKTLTKKLVSIPSMNATSGERDIADELRHICATFLISRHIRSWLSHRI